MCIMLTIVIVVLLFNLSSGFKIGTYNIWNTMFNWETRKLRIAEMIHEAAPDIIGFQEVRSSLDGTKNQLQELNDLLPEYRWKVYHATDSVESIFNLRGWEREGIGLLSKRPIVRSSIQGFSFHESSAGTMRAALHATVRLDSSTTIDMAVIHFSTDRQQQCQNAMQLIQYIQKHRLKNMIILGDFNTYKDFEGPVSLLTNQHSVSDCTTSIQESSREYKLSDSWMSLHNAKAGLTFTNMPTPGFESRPDRILVSQNFEVTAANIYGNGTMYKKKYSKSIKYNRMLAIIHSAYRSFRGIHENPCWHDCGPHGSCRCGVCIAGGNKNNCQLPECSECTGYMWTIFMSLSIFIIFLAMHICAALMQILLSSKNQNVYHYLGCTCCLCNPRLYVSSTFLSRRSKWTNVCARWPLFRIPPMILLFLCLIFVIATLVFGSEFFAESLDIVDKVMQEEFYPSDHLMLTAEIS